MKRLIVFLIFILTCLFIRLSHAEEITWSFDDTPTIKECVEQSANTYEVCEILVPMAIRAMKEDCIYIGTTKEDE